MWTALLDAWKIVFVSACILSTLKDRDLTSLKLHKEYNLEPCATKLRIQKLYKKIGTVTVYLNSMTRFQTFEPQYAISSVAANSEAS